MSILQHCQGCGQKKQETNNDWWVKNQAGLFVPTEYGDKHVDRAQFRVEVKGFRPKTEEKGKT